MECLDLLRFMLMTHYDMWVICLGGYIRYESVMSHDNLVGACLKPLLLLDFYYSIHCSCILILLYCTYVQALASERELLLMLLDPDTQVDSGPTADQFAKSSENGSGKTESDLTFVLDRIFEGVCRPFKVRVEQVLQSQPNLIVSYKLSNTLEFYSYTVSCHHFFSPFLILAPYIFFLS